MTMRSGGRDAGETIFFIYNRTAMKMPRANRNPGDCNSIPVLGILSSPQMATKTTISYSPTNQWLLLPHLFLMSTSTRLDGLIFFCRRIARHKLIPVKTRNEA